jgi:hypothetical protein
MTSVFRVGITVLAAFMLTLPVGASPLAGRALTHSHDYDGFLRRLFHPKVDLGHTARALTYPVKKTAGNGVKAVMDGGKEATNVAVAAAASGYVASKKPGIATLLPKK